MIIEVVILGAGGNSLEIVETIEVCNKERRQYNIIGFLDDNKEILGNSIIGYKVLGVLVDFKKFSGNTKFINGIGNYESFKHRKNIIENIGLPLDRYITIIHPAAYVSNRATVGLGTVIFQHCTIGIDALIGNHVIILPNSVVQHNSCIGDFSCLGAGVIVSGNVLIKESCYIASGTVIRDGITIYEKTLVGIGSVVTKDIESDRIVMGVPAKEKQ